MTSILGRCCNWLAWIWANVRRHPFAVGVVVVVLAGAGTMVSRIDPLEWRLMSEVERQDRADLAEIGAAFRSYAAENRDTYPPSTFAPDFGLPDLSAMKEYLSPQLVERISSKSKARLCYLGYALEDDDRAYKLFDAWQKQGAAADPRRDVDLEPNNNYGADGTKRWVCRLKEGVERFFITDIMAPANNPKLLSNIPILWEMPTSDRPGGLVVFLDGHVEWVSYPGAFPMNEELIIALRQSMDDSGANFARPTSPVRDLARRIAEVARCSFAGYVDGYGLRLSQCDVVPSVHAGDARGYRVVFGKKEVKRMRLSGVQTRYDKPQMEFVLFPENEPAPGLATIPWTTKPHTYGGPDQRDYLGDGYGYHWFANAPEEVAILIKGKVLVKGRQKADDAK